MVTTRGGPTVGIPCEDKQSCGVSDLLTRKHSCSTARIRYKVYGSGVHIPNQSEGELLASAFALFGLF
jgi:hypothetical protein